MAIVRWEPFRGYSRFGNLNRFMSRFLDDFAHDDEDTSIHTWSPRMEVIESDDQFELEAELPGMSKEDVKIEMHDNILTISGDKSVKREQKDHKILLCERAFGSFSRSFNVTSQIDAEKIKAEFKNGVLNLILPKVEKEKPKQITISDE